MAKRNRKPDFTLVLLGFQGSGKSATGNSILKHKYFQTGIGTMGTTKRIQRESWSYRDKLVTIVDTPAISKTVKLDKIRKEMKKDEIDTAVYAIIITIGRFTDEEKEIVSSMLAKFSETLKRRTILVFTRHNELEEVIIGDNRSRLEAWLDTTPTIREWIVKYNFRYFAIENTNQEEHQMIEKEMMESLLDIEHKVQENNVSGVNSDDAEIQEYRYGLFVFLGIFWVFIANLFRRYFY